MWARIEGHAQEFEDKAQKIRNLLLQTGSVGVTSGSGNYRAQISRRDIDHIGHFRGIAREKD